MIWLAWRQHRAALAILTVLALAFVAYLMWQRSVIAAGVDALGACIDPTAAGCAFKYATFQGTDAGVAAASVVPRIAMILMPGLAGAFLGTPLLGADLEVRREELIWTQAVGRLRWALTKIIMVGVPLGVVVWMLAWSTAWWLDAAKPLSYFYSEWTGFDVIGLSPLGYTLFAFVFGCLVGVIVRRTLAGMVITLVVFGAVRAAIALGVRATIFASPLTYNAGSGTSLPPDSWIISRTLAGLPPHVAVLYQPADRFIHLQLSEFGLYAAMSALCLAGVVFMVTRYGRSRPARKPLHVGMPPAL